jgi:hypothetical protein
MHEFLLFELTPEPSFPNPIRAVVFCVVGFLWVVLFDLRLDRLARGVDLG